MELYGLVGYPLGHSFSAKIHENWFAQKGIEARYVNFEIEDLSQLSAQVFCNKNLRGFNVTAPFKEKIISMLDEIDSEAEHVGAVNVVKILEDGKLKGFNTDVYGFRESLRETLSTETLLSALVLGTGGAAKAVECALRSYGTEVTFVTRNKKEKASFFAGRCLEYGELNEEMMNKFDLIVNATPSGTYPKVDICPSIPYTGLSERHICFDLVYNPAETLFLSKCRSQGATTINGMRMLELQAERSRQIWLDRN